MHALSAPAPASAVTVTVSACPPTNTKTPTITAADPTTLANVGTSPWKAYSSAEALRAKLVYAIFNCVSIDGDNTSQGMAAAARGWDEASGDGDMSDNPAQAWWRH